MHATCAFARPFMCVSSATRKEAAEQADNPAGLKPASGRAGFAGARAGEAATHLPTALMSFNMGEFSASAPDLTAQRTRQAARGCEGAMRDALMRGVTIRADMVVWRVAPCISAQGKGSRIARVPHHA